LVLKSKYLYFQATGISKGYGFVTFYEAEDAKQAMEQMNGLDIAGKPIKVSTVTDTSATTAGSLELEEFDRLEGGARYRAGGVGSAKVNGRSNVCREIGWLFLM
jgi:RNA recognition motif. (a.k.a. RRM, RBD, or RNP domain)